MAFHNKIAKNVVCFAQLKLERDWRAVLAFLKRNWEVLG